ncbi:hypothetical protein DL96DRAFT_1577265 [Flagelloscypha sp. PMI_526]|nr:hypothetical protein DL96DRAFT_1577265 [Flagelloscypha sp. PMI_526]
MQRRLATAVERSPHIPRPNKKPVLHTSILLNRSPFLTRTPTKFEEAYWAYQGRIRRALHNPFPYDVYFRPGSLIQTRFNVEERAREVHAFGENFVQKREEAGIGGQSIVSESQVAAAETLRSQEGVGEALMSRETDADRTNDLKSLDRLGQRNLFCLLHTTSDGWRFPQGSVLKQELLHHAAQRDLTSECGENMDTWIVSRQPIGHYELPTVEHTDPPHHVFFYKAHIMAGQIRPQTKNITDFAWLTKQEIKPLVSESYWAAIQDMLSDV